MPYVTPFCADCIHDEQAVRQWQKAGGLMPPVTCTAEHVARCRACKMRKVQLNDDGRCDECWLLKEQKERPLPGQETQEAKG